jgi:heptaprenyl diphosphate synthase
MPKTKKLSLMAMLTAASLIVFVIEAQIPAPVPVPGVKLGLANVITLIAMLLLGRREAGLILAVRIVMGSVFAGGVSAFLFSISGGVLAYAVMCITVTRFPRKMLWVVSALAAVAHNLGQLLAAIAVTKTAALMVYAPVLLASGIITGVFTGLVAMYLVRRLDKTRQ